MKSFNQIVNEALTIIHEHAVGAEIDAAFDGGEWSGPSHADSAAKDVEALAVAHGFTYDQVMDEIYRMVNESEPFIN